MANIYSIYRDGQLILEGECKYICHELGIGHTTLYNHAKNGSRFEKNGIMYQVVENNESRNDEYSIVKNHLIQYGNTVMVVDPTETVTKLQKDGIRVNVEKYINNDSNYCPKRDWILTKI